MNSWFDHGVATAQLSKSEPEFCCGSCMAECIKKKSCVTCQSKILAFQPKVDFDNKSFVVSLTQFLETLKINEQSPESTPAYIESSVGKNKNLFIYVKIIIQFYNFSYRNCRRNGRN